MTDKQTLQLIGNSAGYYLKAYIHNMFKVLPLWSANESQIEHEQVFDVRLDPQGTEDLMSSLPIEAWHELRADLNYICLCIKDKIFGVKLNDIATWNHSPEPIPTNDTPKEFVMATFPFLHTHLMSEVLTIGLCDQAIVNATTIEGILQSLDSLQQIQAITLESTDINGIEDSIPTRVHVLINYLANKIMDATYKSGMTINFTDKEKLELFPETELVLQFATWVLQYRPAVNTVNIGYFYNTPDDKTQRWHDHTVNDQCDSPLSILPATSSLLWCSISNLIWKTIHTIKGTWFTCPWDEFVKNYSEHFGTKWIVQTTTTN